MAPEVTHLLAKAVELVYEVDNVRGESIVIGDTEYRLIMDRAEPHGWVLVLMKEATLSPGDFDLMMRYGLTERQVEVARLLADRYSNREIAETLGIRLSTAGRHTENVMKKLGVGSRTEVRAKLRGLCLEN